MSNRDLLKLARHFGVSYKQAEQRYTKSSPIGRILRQKKDDIYKWSVSFLIQKRASAQYTTRGRRFVETMPTAVVAGTMTFSRPSGDASATTSTYRTLKANIGCTTPPSNARGFERR